MSNLNINRVVLGGRLTDNIELKQTQSGVFVCSFTIAVTRKSNREVTDFIDCVAWRNTAEFISKYFHKGSSICVIGSMQTRSWTDSNGNKRFVTELIVDDTYFVDSKSDSAPTSAQQNEPTYEEVNDESDLPF